MRDFYKILIPGASGSGKSYSFRNLDPEKTGYVNVENQPLPFKNKFKHFTTNKGSSTEYLKALIEYAKDPTITAIVFDSFSAYMDMVLAESRALYKGFDVWSNYNSQIAQFHNILNKIQKEVFITGHYEILNVEGNPEKRLKVQGKENEGIVERHYTMVLYADSKFVDANKRPEYFFKLTGEGLSAKCPPEIFGPDTVTIPNDAQFVLEKVQEFTK